MNQQQLLDILMDIRGKLTEGKEAYEAGLTLVNRVIRTVQTDATIMPMGLVQAQIDEIVSNNTPLYNAALTRIEAAGDALGTDLFG